MTMPKGERLRHLRRKHQLNQRQLGRLLGDYDQGFISRIEQGRYEGTFDFWQAAARQFGVTVDYFVSERVARELTAADDAAGHPRIHQVSPDDIELSKHADEPLLVPVYNVEASAGGGLLAETEYVNEYLRIDRRWFVHTTGLDPDGRFAIVRVAGDSMAETLGSGDLILVNLDDAALNDGLFCIRIDEMVMVKRLSCQPEGMVQIVSDNPRYPVKTWHRDQFSVIGRVVMGWTHNAY